MLKPTKATVQSSLRCSFQSPRAAPNTPATRSRMRRAAKTVERRSVVSNSTMGLKRRPTPVWPVAIAITLVVALTVSAHSAVRATALSIPLQSPESPPITLTLECVDSATIRFEITNVGTTDTALPLGSALANGRIYMIDNLNLRMKPANGNGTDYHYSPRHYPVAIGGRLDRWFQAFPAGASYRMSAKLEDFFGFTSQDSFPRGVELSLRWTMSAETPKSLFPLVFWTGTLVSNTCTAP